MDCYGAGSQSAWSVCGGDEGGGGGGGGCVEDELLDLRARLAQSEAQVTLLRAQVAWQHTMLSQLQGDLLMGGSAPEAPADGARNEDAIRENPLVLAARNGDSRMVDVLLSAGADVGVGGDAPLLAACQHGHAGVVEVLIHHGANVHVDHDSPLLWAVHRGDAKVLRLLLDNGANPDTLGGCPLRLAAGLGHHDIARALLSAGAQAGSHFRSGT